MWRGIDIKAMSNFEFISPSLDLGCGDGIFSFVRAVGQFDLSFDAFHTMSNLDKYFDNVDVFDTFDASVSPIITRSPNYMIDYGFDHKENLLNKADKLGLYREMMLGNANNTLPFQDNSFMSIFSNIVYWLDEPNSVFQEIARILKKGGKACFMLPNKTFPNFSFYNQLYVKQGKPEWQFLEKLDRGRFADNIRQARSVEDWVELFDGVGLNVISHNTHLSKVAIQIWDIGLRPLFPVLKKMVNNLSEEDLLDVKKEWINIIRQFVEPIINMDDKLDIEIEPAFHCFILEK